MEIVLKEKSDIRNTYNLTNSTQWIRSRNPEKIESFKPGDKIVLHLRKIRGENARSVSEVTDAETWKWLTSIRKEIQSGLLKAITEDSIETLLTPENSPFTYSISDKTLYYRDGKSVSAKSFKAGDHIAILPRALPSGKVMARGVADTPSGAALLKERLKTTISGSLISIDSNTHKLKISTSSGDHRELSFADTVNIWIGTKPATFADLQPGNHLKLRIHSDDTGEEIISEIKKDVKLPKRSQHIPKKR